MADFKVILLSFYDNIIYLLNNANLKTTSLLINNQILEKASELLHNQLRMDENTPDLIEQFTCRTDTNQRYYIEPYKSLHWGSMVSITNELTFNLANEY